jgi:hypothetical protein
MSNNPGVMKRQAQGSDTASEDLEKRTRVPHGFPDSSAS